MRVTLLAALALLAPAAARAGASIGIEGFYGLKWPQSPSFSAAVSGISNSPDLFATTLQTAGGDVLIDLGGLELGGIVDTTFGHQTATQTAIGGLVGLGLPTGVVKIDLLGEVGGHRIGNIASNPDIATSSSSNEWLFYVGLRPGFTVKLGEGPFFVGLWGFVRWDVTNKNVPVTVGSAGSAGSYKLGGTTLGATLRFGFAL